MAKDDVERAVVLLLTDSDFRAKFNSDANSTLEANHLRLTAEEVKALSNLKQEDLHFAVEEKHHAGIAASCCSADVVRCDERLGRCI